MFVKQVSVFVENKAGRAAKVTRILGESCVSIRAMSIADTTTFGVMHMILDDTDKGVLALKNAHMMLSVTNVLAVRMEDKPGELNAILETLGNAGVSVEYLYAFVTKTPNTAAVIIRVDDSDNGLDKALTALKTSGMSLLSASEI